jgi:hypothetical protein
VRKVGSVVITKQESSRRALVLIDIHVALYIMRDVHKLTDMEERAILKVNIAPYEANGRTPLVIGDAGGVHNAG